MTIYQNLKKEFGKFPQTQEELFELCKDFTEGDFEEFMNIKIGWIYALGVTAEFIYRINNDEKFYVYSPAYLYPEDLKILIKLIDNGYNYHFNFNLCFIPLEAKFDYKNLIYNYPLFKGELLRIFGFHVPNHYTYTFERISQIDTYILTTVLNSHSVTIDESKEVLEILYKNKGHIQPALKQRLDEIYINPKNKFLKVALGLILDITDSIDIEDVEQDNNDNYFVLFANSYDMVKKIVVKEQLYKYYENFYSIEDIESVEMLRDILDFPFIKTSTFGSYINMGTLYAIEYQHLPKYKILLKGITECEQIALKIFEFRVDAEKGIYGDFVQFVLNNAKFDTTRFKIHTASEPKDIV